MRLRSPLSLNPLRHDGHVLVSGEERWPVVDGIAYLRADRRALADEVLALLDDGDTETATVRLLGDADDGAPARPSHEDVREAVRRRDTLTFRDAMALLGLGVAGTYFAHRWSDPTFLSGLALAQSHWQSPRRVLEVACGAGHYLRAFAPHAGEVVGADTVFALLWLARHFVAPQASLVCFDMAATWPFEDHAVDLLFCQEAFHTFAGKHAAASEMARVASRVLVGRVHNALVDATSPGHPLTPSAAMSLFPGCTLFADTELAAAMMDGRIPAAARPNEVAGAAAVAIAWGNTLAGVADGPLTRPRPGAKLRRNPLYQSGRIRWPSDRYASDFAATVTYPARTDAPETAFAGMSAAVDAMARTRVLLDLPERW